MALILIFEEIKSAIIDENLSTFWDRNDCVYCQSARPTHFRIPCKVRIWYTGMVEPRCLQEDSMFISSTCPFAHPETVGIKAALRIDRSWAAKSREAVILLKAVVNHGTFPNPEEYFFIKYGGAWLNISKRFPALSLASHSGDPEDFLIREIGRNSKSL